MTMQLENTSALGRKLSIEVPADQITSQYEKKVADYCKTARIDGFRKGKIPSSVIKERYGDGIYSEVIREALTNSLTETLKNQSLEPVTAPRIEKLEASQGKNLQYEACFDIYPTIPLDLSKIQIDKKNFRVAEKDIDATIERLRKQQAGWKPVERAAIKGDKLFLDVKVDVEGASVKDMHRLPAELGSGTMIPGFEDGLIDKKVGEEVILNLTFPNPYFDRDIAGKPAKFTIQVLEVLEPELPSDELLMEKLGVKGDTEALRSKIQEHIEREANQILKAELKNQVWNKLLEAHQFDLPQSLIEKELHQLLHPNQAHDDFHHHHDATPEQTQQAENKVKTGLMMGELMKTYNVKPDTERMLKKIQELSTMFEDSTEAAKQYYQNKNFLAQLQASTLEEQLVDEVLKVAQVTEHDIHYDELFNQGAQ